MSTLVLTRRSPLRRDVSPPCPDAAAHGRHRSTRRFTIGADAAVKAARAYQAAVWTGVVLTVLWPRS